MPTKKAAPSSSKKASSARKAAPKSAATTRARAKKATPPPKKTKTTTTRKAAPAKKTVVTTPRRSKRAPLPTDRLGFQKTKSPPKRQYGVVKGARNVIRFPSVPTAPLLPPSRRPSSSSPSSTAPPPKTGDADFEIIVMKRLLDSQRAEIHSLERQLIDCKTCKKDQTKLQKITKALRDRDAAERRFGRLMGLDGGGDDDNDDDDGDYVPAGAAVAKK